ncbi:hypothetical protein [Neptunomonas sp.]
MAQVDGPGRRLRPVGVRIKDKLSEEALGEIIAVRLKLRAGLR